MFQNENNNTDELDQFFPPIKIADEELPNDPNHLIDGENSSQPPLKKRNKALTRTISIFLWLLIVLLISFIIFFNVFSLVRVQGNSMNDTLEDRQHILLFRTRNARRGDIIVYSINRPYPQLPQNIIKRVIGIGGDRLIFARVCALSPTYIFINKNGYFEKLYEPYLNDGNRILNIGITSHFSHYITYDIINVLNPYYTVPEQYIITVPHNKLFVLGDNRNNSTDSRNTGFISRDAVVGRLSLEVERESGFERFLLFIYGGRTEKTEN